MWPSKRDRSNSPDGYVKKRRIGSQNEGKAMSKKTCASCETELALNQFPKHRRPSAHQHERNTCRNCFRNWVNSQIESKPWDQIGCPECSTLLQYDKIKAFAQEATFDKSVITPLAHQAHD